MLSSTVMLCAPARLHVDVASRQARQDQRLLAVDDMAAIELGVDSHRQLQPPHRRPGDLRVGCRRDEIPAQPDEHLGRSVDHRLDRVHHGMAMMLRRANQNTFSILPSSSTLGLLVDPDRPVALNIGMAAHRADAGARPAEIAPQQQQIGDLLHVLGAAAMLGDPHAVADDGAIWPRCRRAAIRSICAARRRRRAGCPPRVRADVLGQRLEARRVLLDEGDVQHGRASRLERRLMGLEHQLHDALQHSDVAADIDLAILARDAGRAEASPSRSGFAARRIAPARVPAAD